MFNEHDEDQYNEMLQWSINEVVSHIELIADLEADALESLYYSMFDEDIYKAYAKYIQECQTP